MANVKTYPDGGDWVGNGQPKQSGIAGGGDGPHDPVMESRVVALENGMQEVRAVLGRLEPLLARIDERMHKIEVDMAEMKGRLQGLPTTWAMVTTVIGGQIALAGVLLGAMRVLGSH